MKDAGTLKVGDCFVSTKHAHRMWLGFQDTKEICSTCIITNFRSCGRCDILFTEFNGKVDICENYSMEHIVSGKYWRRV